MAQLKSSVVQGSLRVTDTTYTTNLNLSSATASYAVVTDSNKNLITENLTVSAPTASGNATAFITSVSQGATGKINASKATIPTASTSTAGIVKLTDSYTSTDDSNATTGKALLAALQTLDVTAITGSASKTLTSISETDGKISATYSDISIGAGAISSGTLGVARGGTGASSFTENSAIISGSTTTAALTTRAIYNRTTVGDLEWTAAATDVHLVTKNTIAYWDGAFRASDHKSNLKYLNGATFLGSSASNYTATISGTSAATMDSTGTPTSGALVVNGGISVGGESYLHGTVHIYGNAASHPLMVRGISGCGDYGVQESGTAQHDLYLNYVDGNVHVSNNSDTAAQLLIESTTVSTDTTTGALVVKGGVGIAKDLFVGYAIKSQTFFAKPTTTGEAEVGIWLGTNSSDGQLYLYRQPTGSHVGSGLYCNALDNEGNIIGNILERDATTYRYYARLQRLVLKQYTDSHMINMTTINPWPSLSFGSRPGTTSGYTMYDNEETGLICFFNYAKRTSDSYVQRPYFKFRQFSINSSTNQKTDYFHDFYLPPTPTDLTATGTYEIATQKGIEWNFKSKLPNVSRQTIPSSTVYRTCPVFVASDEAPLGQLEYCKEQSTGKTRVQLYVNADAPTGTNNYGGLIIFSAYQTTTAYTCTYDINQNIFTAGKVYNAVWNDYAECRRASIEEPGRVVTETSSGIMELTTKRLMPGCKVISDTFGTLMGETENTKTPIAVAGRVLVYPYQVREKYELGAAVCSAPNGTVDIMTREEIKEYPERILGTVSEIPEYTEWRAGDKDQPTYVKVNGRIWIYVR